MRNYQVLLTFVFLNMSQGAIGQETSSTNELDACAYDRAAMLALEEDAFDQDMDGGWRALARDPNCWDVAADLIRDYREMRGLTSLILYWHEGQLRAFMGDVQIALQLFENSYRSEDGGLGWNIYVDATIAFMKQDMPALAAAREAFAVPAATGDTVGRCKGQRYRAAAVAAESARGRWTHPMF